MYVLTQCVICGEIKGAETTEPWNNAPTCRPCYSALTSLYFDPENPRTEDGELRGFIAKATERAQKWVADNEEVRKAQEAADHKNGAEYLRRLFGGKTNDQR